MFVENFHDFELNSMSISNTKPGPIILFGSGETSPSGQRVFDLIFQHLPENPRIAILETPAGFELNSDKVADRIAVFLQHHLQNYRPEVDIVPARKRGTPFSPDDEKIANMLLKADLIIAGPGSPSYTVRQLHKSLTWHYLLTQHRLGAALVFSSAAVISLSAQALPVYEIYKVGEDPHWKPGLNFFGPYRIPLVFIPHWNNRDGGEELDTSRCFLGQERFESMLEMLPVDHIVVGIDEHTALWLDCADQCCKVLGLGSVTILKDGKRQEYSTGESFQFSDLLECHIPDPTDGIPLDVWQAAQNTKQSKFISDSDPPKEVMDLVELRQASRVRNDWSAADKIRDQIAAMGWHVKDTPGGPVISRD